MRICAVFYMELHLKAYIYLRFILNENMDVNGYFILNPIYYLDTHQHGPRQKLNPFH